MYHKAKIIVQMKYNGIEDAFPIWMNKSPDEDGYDETISIIQQKVADFIKDTYDSGSENGKYPFPSAS